MLEANQMKEVLKDYCVNLRFHARGGQGGVTAADLCVESYDGYGVSQPKFGAERMGSPTMSFVRLSANYDLVRSNEQVYSPHFVSVLDESLLSEIDVTAGMAEGGWLIVNTTMNQSEIEMTLGKKNLNIATIDATNIAMEVLGRNITNTIILGALVRVSNIFTMEQLADAIMARFKGELAGKNVKAINRAFEETCLYESPSAGSIDFTKDTKILWQQASLGLPGYKELDLAGVWYTDNNVIKVGSDQVNTGSWGEWNIIWDEEKCTNCAQCWYICPDFAIVIVNDEEKKGKYKMAGIDQFHCKSCQNCIETCPVKAISKELKQGPGSCAVPET